MLKVKIYMPLTARKTRNFISYIFQQELIKGSQNKNGRVSNSNNLQEAQQ
jgi:hypothetical protein